MTETPIGDKKVKQGRALQTFSKAKVKDIQMVEREEHNILLCIYYSTVMRSFKCYSLNIVRDITIIVQVIN